MRAQRLDQEDLVADITRSCDAVKKEQETLKQKMKRVEQSIFAIQTEIQDFQRQKQAKLNEIDVTVLLHLHQIEYLVDQRLPADLSNALVFSSTDLARLRSRIDVRLQPLFQHAKNIDTDVCTPTCVSNGLVACRNWWRRKPSCAKPRKS
jgi:hypothetical protein